MALRVVSGVAICHSLVSVTTDTNKIAFGEVKLSRDLGECAHITKGDVRGGRVGVWGFYHRTLG